MDIVHAEFIEKTVFMAEQQEQQEQQVKKCSSNNIDANKKKKKNNNLNQEEIDNNQSEVEVEIEFHKGPVNSEIGIMGFDLSIKNVKSESNENKNGQFPFSVQYTNLVDDRIFNSGLVRDKFEGATECGL